MGGQRGNRFALFQTTYKLLIATHLTFGENRHAIVTLADRLIVTDMLVIRSGT